MEKQITVDAIPRDVRKMLFDWKSVQDLFNSPSWAAPSRSPLRAKTRDLPGASGRTRAARLVRQPK